jgi:general transcription factor 3C polypeptide 2
MLPARTWKPQLKPLLLLCAFIFFGTLLGADGIPPVVSMRTHAMDGLALDPELLPGYSYVLANLGPLTITRKSLNLAISAACLTFSVIQAAALTLLTTTEESMALALGWFLHPLRVIGVPVKQLVFSLLLSLRFMSLVSSLPVLPCPPLCSI